MEMVNFPSPWAFTVHSPHTDNNHCLLRTFREISAKALKQAALLDTIKTYSDGTGDVHLERWKLEGSNDRGRYRHAEWLGYEAFRVFSWSKRALQIHSPHRVVQTRTTITIYCLARKNSLDTSRVPCKLVIQQYLLRNVT